MSTPANTPEMSADEYREWRTKPEAEAKEEPTEETTEEAPAAEPEPETEPASEPEPESEPEVEPEEKPKVRGGFQKKIDKLTKRNHELEAQLLQERSAKPLAEKAAAAKPESQSDEEPKPENFGTDREYLTALAKFTLKQEAKALRAAEAQEQEAEAARQTVDAYRKSETAAKAKYEDYDEVVTDEVVIPKIAEPLIREAGAEVAYYLGKHPEVGEAMLSMTPAQVALEIGKISANLEKPLSKTKPASSAPEPIKPVTGSAKVAVPLHKIEDADEYARRRRSELKAARR